MKIPSKKSFNKSHFNHSPDVGFEGVMIFYKKYSSTLQSFLVTNTTLALDNPLHFRKNLLGRIGKLIMSIDDNIINYKTTV